MSSPPPASPAQIRAANARVRATAARAAAAAPSPARANTSNLRNRPTTPQVPVPPSPTIAALPISYHNYIIAQQRAPAHASPAAPADAGHAGSDKEVMLVVFGSIP